MVVYASDTRGAFTRMVRLDSGVQDRFGEAMLKWEMSSRSFLDVADGQLGQSTGLDPLQSLGNHHP